MTNRSPEVMRIFHASAILLLKGLAFANKCVLDDVTTGYNVKECDTAHPIEADYCYLWCAPGWNGEYPTATCDANTGSFILSGCEQCTSTLPGCCSSTGQTCTMCEQGYFLHDGSCTPCPAHCANCWGGQWCHLCESGYGPKGQIGQGVDICQPCSTGCLECFDSTHCLACDEDNGYRASANNACEPFSCEVGPRHLCQACVPLNQRTWHNQCTACNDGGVLAYWGNGECRSCDDIFVTKAQCENDCPGFIWDPSLGRIGKCKRESCIVPAGVAGAAATGVCGANKDIINNGAPCTIACASGYYAAKATTDCNFGVMATPLCLADSCSSCYGNAGCVQQGASECYIDGTVQGGMVVSKALCQQHAHFGLEWCDGICAIGTSWDLVSKTCDACPSDANCKTQGGNYCCHECMDGYGLNMSTRVCEACPLSTPTQNCQIPGGNYCCEECHQGYTLNVNTLRCEASIGNANQLVSVELKLVALDYNQVMAQPTLKEDLVDSIKDAILSTLPGWYTRNDIYVRLSQGSVIANVEITAKNATWTSALRSRLLGEEDAILKQVLSMAIQLVQNNTNLDLLEDGKGIADIMATMRDPKQKTTTKTSSDTLNNAFGNTSSVTWSNDTEPSGTHSNSSIGAPTEAPTAAPNVAPTDADNETDGMPNNTSTGVPTEAPTEAPTLSPKPTVAPSEAPIVAPTEAPSDTDNGTDGTPSSTSSGSPTESPTVAPSVAPTLAPTQAPTDADNTTHGTQSSTSTSAATESPSEEPIEAPTDAENHTDGTTSSTSIGATTDSPTHTPTLAPAQTTTDKSVDETPISVACGMKPTLLLCLLAVVADSVTTQKVFPL